MRSFFTYAVFVSTAVVLTACSSVKLEEKPPVEEHVTAPVDNSRKVAPVVATVVDPLDDKNGVLAKRSVYFDLDSYVVKDEYKSVVSAHGNYLSTHKNRKVTIQGNTDERGGREYNLALGQKRAEAVRKALSLLGVADSQMEAVSFGKEKPKATGSDEASWAENRRSDIAY